MLSSIHPLGERTRHSRWSVTVVAYVVGSVAGGMSIGALVGSAGAAAAALAAPSPRLLALAALAAVGAALLFELHVGGMTLPSIRRQVNEDWLNGYRGWVYGVSFGFQLGFAFDVVVTSAAIYATFALTFMEGSVVAGLLIGTVFGLVRGMTIVTTVRVDTVARLRAFHRRLQAAAPWGRRLVVAGETAVIAVLALAVMGW